MTAKSKKKRNDIVLSTIIILIILIAYISVFFWPEYAYISNSVYIVLFMIWGISVRRRIIQRQVQVYLCSIAALMVFWIVTRTVKWKMVTNIDAIRYLWYAFYIPILFIPILSLFVVLSLGKPEHYRLPKSVGFLMVPAVILLIAVFTNDYHQLVFKFPQAATEAFVGRYHYSDKDYSYNIGYFIITAWSLLVAFTTMGLMNFKFRAPRSRKIVWQPLIPLAMLIIYVILYIANWAPLRLFARDMTIIFCLLITVIWENCIRTGLIQSNSRYDELFRAATIGVQIIDDGGNVLLASDGAAVVEKELLIKVQSEPVFISEGMRLSSAAVKGGHVVWHEDVSRLARLLEELQDTNEHLQGENIMLQEKYATRRQHHYLRERNRIYNKLQNQTQGQIRLLSELVERLKISNDSEDEKTILAKIAVISAYIKRRNNLIFLSEDNNAIPAAELEYCLNESIQNLTLFGIPGDYLFDVSDTMPFSEIMCVYDAFENVIEQAFDTLTSLYLYVGRDDGEIIMTIRLSSNEYMFALMAENLTVEAEDDGQWQLIFRIPKGGIQL